MSFAMTSVSILESFWCSTCNSDKKSSFIQAWWVMHNAKFITAQWSFTQLFFRLDYALYHCAKQPLWPLPNSDYSGHLNIWIFLQLFRLACHCPSSVKCLVLQWALFELQLVTTSPKSQAPSLQPQARRPISFNMCNWACCISVSIPSPEPPALRQASLHWPLFELWLVAKHWKQQVMQVAQASQHAQLSHEQVSSASLSEVANLG